MLGSCVIDNKPDEYGGRSEYGEMTGNRKSSSSLLASAQASKHAAAIPTALAMRGDAGSNRSFSQTLSLCSRQAQRQGRASSAELHVVEWRVVAASFFGAARR